MPNRKIGSYIFSNYSKKDQATSISVLLFCYILSFYEWHQQGRTCIDLGTWPTSFHVHCSFMSHKKSLRHTTQCIPHFNKHELNFTEVMQLKVTVHGLLLMQNSSTLFLTLIFNWLLVSLLLSSESLLKVPG